MKLKIILPLLSLGVIIAWTGSSYVISQKTESVFEQQILQNKQYFEQQLTPIKWERVSYESSLGSAKAKTKLTFEMLVDGTKEPIVIPLNHSIQHGPIFFPSKTESPRDGLTQTNDTLGLGASRWLTTIDTSIIAPEKWKKFSAGFGDTPPINLTSDFALNGDITLFADFAPFSSFQDDLDIVFKGAQLHSTIIDNRPLGKSTIDIGEISIRTPKGLTQIAKSQMHLNIPSYLSGIALGTFNWDLDNTLITISDAPEISFSANMNSRTEIDQESFLAADMQLAITELIAPTPITSASIDIGYYGLSTDGLNHLDNLQTKVQQASTKFPQKANPSQQELLEQQQRLSALLMVEAEKVIQATLIPGKSGLSVKLKAQTDTQTSFANLNLKYPADAPEIKLNSPNSSSGKPNITIAKDSIDGELEVSLEDSLFDIPLLQASMPNLVQQGLFIHENQAYELSATFDDGLVLVNGVEFPVSFSQ